MAGTLVAYQGFVCTAVRFRRSLGLRPDTSIVRIPIATFDRLGQTVVPPPPGRLLDLVGGVNPGAALLAAAPSQHTQPRVLNPRGELIFAQVNPAGFAVAPAPVVVKDLFVTEASKLDAGQASGILVVTLTDLRAFLDRGPIRRWRYNQRDASGDLVADTGGDDGRPLTIRQIVEEILEDTFSPSGNPLELVVVPDDWDKERPEVTLPPYSQPLAALAEIERRFDVSFALHLDGTIGFYKEGEGRVGVTPDGGGQPGGNDTPINSLRSAGLVEHLGGQGDEHGEALGYPPEFVVVAGGERIADVTVDCWRPVVLIDGAPIPLERAIFQLGRGRAETAITEEIARLKALQGSADEPDTQTAAEIAALEAQLVTERQRLEREGQAAATAEETERVQALVLRPDWLAHSPLFDAKGGKLILRDAYQLWQLRGADAENRHLLPIRNRAAARNGIRLLPLVENYRWRFRDFALAPGFLSRTAADIRIRRGLTDPLQDRLLAARMEMDAYAKLIAEARSITATAGSVEEVLRNEGLIVETAFRGFGLPAELIENAKIALDALTFNVGRTRVTLTVPPIAVLIRAFDFPPGENPIDRALADTDSGLGAGVTAAQLGLTERGGRLATSGRAAVSEAARRGFALLCMPLTAEATGDADIIRMAAAYRGALARHTEANRLAHADNLADGAFTDDLDIKIFNRCLEIGRSVQGSPGVRGARRPPVGDVIAFVDQLLERRDVANRDAGLAAPSREAQEGRARMFRHLINDPKLPDPDARVVDRDLGLVRTRGPVGSIDVARPQAGEPPFGIPVPNLEGRILIRRALSVTFGARVGPRRLGVGGRVLTGAAEPVTWCPFDTVADVVPRQLLEAQAAGRDLGHVVFAFKRSAGDASPEVIPLDEVPRGRGTVISAPHLVELIELTGDSNERELLREASVLAVEAFKGRVDKRVRDRTVLLFPQRVNVNGNITSIEIATREGARGVRTTLLFGGRTFAIGGETRVRRPDPETPAGERPEDEEG